MKLKVTIRVINPVRTGVSQSTGRAWKSQDVVVAWTEKLVDGRDYENIQLVSMRGDQVDRFAAIGAQVGRVLDVDLAFSTRTYNGKVYNENVMFI